MTGFLTLVRGLARTPLFTLIAVSSLALGIGANTAIFSLLDRALFQSLPVRDPDELVFLYHPGPVQGSVSVDEGGDPSFSYPMFRELQKEQSPFTGLAAARSQPASLAYKNAAALGTVRLVSGSYFGLLGVRPSLGRILTADDDRTPGGHPQGVLSYRYWTTRFGNDIAVLNRTILVNGFPLTIVGVAQKGFTSEKFGDAPDVFAPLCMKGELTPEWKGLDDRRNYWISLFGRLKPGLTLSRAETEINVAYRGQLELDIQLLRQPSQEFLERFKAKKIVLKPGQYARGGLRNQSGNRLYILMGMAVLVLLIACANLANLQMARAASRTREVAVRLSLGASRIRLVRRFLAEACLVSCAGGLLGLAVARGTLSAMLATLPPIGGLQGLFAPSLDWRVLAFTLGVSIITGVLFGLFPALQSSKVDLVATLKEQAGQVSASRPVNLFRKTLVTGQVAISLALLIFAGLFGMTLVNLSRIDLGIQTDRLMTFSLLPKLNHYSDQSTANLHDRLTERLAAIPGVTLVTASQVPAVAGSSSATSIAIEGYAAAGNEDVSSSFNIVGADYFRTMGIPLVAGREFSASDNLGGTRVAVVNEAFVRKFFAGRNPLDYHLGQSGSTAPDVSIVGVVKDAKYSDMRQPVPPVFYRPLAQSRHWSTLCFYLRTANDPERVAEAVRLGVASIDPTLPIRGLKSMRKQLEENTSAERMVSLLTASFAGLANVLAAVGLYGLLSYNLARRTREIGIRVALGADARRVCRLVFREVGLLLAIGTFLGLGLSAAAGKLLQSFLYGLKPWDVTVYVAALVAIWMVALAAAGVPTWHAARLDPWVALRYE